MENKTTPPPRKSALRSLLANLREPPGRFRSSLVRSGLPTTDRSRSIFVFGNVFLHVHPVRVHRRTLRRPTTRGLGAFAASAFLLTLVSGILLMFYCKPYPAVAYDSIKDIHFVVPTGRFLRNIHRWAANVMVVAVLLHMARAFYTAAYRPREFNWVVGMGLMVATPGLSFNRYCRRFETLSPSEGLTQRHGKNRGSRVVIVDTSVWIDYFRGLNPAVGKALDGLLEEDRAALVAPVRLELILGCRRSQPMRLLRLLDALPVLPVVEGTWTVAEQLSLELSGAGVTAGAVDLLIAALASEHGARLWTLDKDFNRLFQTNASKPSAPETVGMGSTRFCEKVVRTRWAAGLSRDLFSRGWMLGLGDVRYEVARRSEPWADFKGLVFQVMGYSYRRPPGETAARWTLFESLSWKCGAQAMKREISHASVTEKIELDMFNFHGMLPA